MSLTRFMYTPSEITAEIGKNAQALRLSKNLSRRTLAEKSGVPASTIKRFELHGAISLESMVLIAAALDELDPMLKLFKPPSPNTLFELQNSKRQRGTR
ncbi:XRE family transcriptional regulator [Pseudomonas sp. 09C 129]|uniref:helix-turn-helix domain-containing protein n=1 Tax=unclassified Pseudomonas TaxID=196821 RepID=UPI000BCE8522|nr:MULTISPECIES: helix-turn-helix transcriptional regulator [unclassified Pseudomonas]AUG00449.1 XRE family transcriptional regulator [Pseudomonas sp. 09C 129]PXX70555.1 helix-turn-helix protein [Pseudomonas sp. LAMO17WK12:I9]SNY31139.1 Helix-turn-helix [Pseudomonas sp. LAMO17WK12:I10]